MKLKESMLCKDSTSLTLVRNREEDEVEVVDAKKRSPSQQYLGLAYI